MANLDRTYGVHSAGRYLGKPRTSCGSIEGLQRATDTWGLALLRSKPGDIPKYRNVLPMGCPYGVRSAGHTARTLYFMGPCNEVKV